MRGQRRCRVVRDTFNLDGDGCRLRGTSSGPHGEAKGGEQQPVTPKHDHGRNLTDFGAEGLHKDASLRSMERMNRKARMIGLLAMILALSTSRTTSAGPRTKGPKLLVVLVVDQMRADYVERFGGQWKGGLGRLFSTGAVFTDAAYPYLQTVTCAGHATIGTGTFPLHHGMVLNGWWNREKGRVMPCTEDPGVTTVSETGKGQAGDSAHLLRAETLGDVMREQLWPKTRVVALSLKARSAIMLGGRRPFASLWFEGVAPVSSTAFTDLLPEFARGFSAFSASTPRNWTPLYRTSAYAFEDAGIAEPAENERFPHEVNEKNWSTSPAGDRALVELASRAVTQLSLGQKDSTDLLAVGFSSLDLVGHAFGPRSHEVQDILFRLDLELARLLSLLDQRLGRDGYVVALSADHGVAALPEQLVALGMDAGRVPLKAVADRLQAQLVSELGTGQWVASVQYTDLYLVTGAYERLRQKPGALARVARAIETMPGIERVFSRDDLLPEAPNCAALCRAASLSYFPGRSGDFVLAPKPNWITVDSGTTHGSSNLYDQHVPLVFWGSGIRPGRYADAASPADIAPTLGALVGVTLPRPDGHVLRAAFSPRR